MTNSYALLISGISVAFAIFFGIKNMSRNVRKDTEDESSKMTTIVVKLEAITTGIAEIKSDIRNMKTDFEHDHERLVKVEASAASAHKRIDTIESEKRGDR